MKKHTDPEVAEMMLDGTLCAGCGVYLDREPAGYPVYCSACRDYDEQEPPVKQVTKIRCPICGVWKVNAFAHAQAKHPRRWHEVFHSDGKLIHEQMTGDMKLTKVTK